MRISPPACIPALLALLVPAVLSCRTPIKAQHAYDPDAPFGSYATWAWMSPEPFLRPEAGLVSDAAPEVSPTLEPMIRDAVSALLTEKGYRRLDSPDASDLVVSFSIGMRERVEIDTYPSGGYVFPAYGRRGGWVGSETVARSYTEGTLAIDFFDARARRAVWHGYAVKRLRRDRPVERALVDEAVFAILEAFPMRTAPRS